MVRLHTTAPGSLDARSVYTWKGYDAARGKDTRVQRSSAPPSDTAAYATRVRCSCGLIPYTLLKALDSANALP